MLTCTAENDSPLIVHIDGGKVTMFSTERQGWLVAVVSIYISLSQEKGRDGLYETTNLTISFNFVLYESIHYAYISIHLTNYTCMTQFLDTQCQQRLIRAIINNI